MVVIPYNTEDNKIATSTAPSVESNEGAIPEETAWEGKLPAVVYAVKQMVQYS